MPATPSPSADAGGVAAARAPAGGGRSFRPRSVQTRLTLAFVLVVALSLLFVSAIVLNRLDEEFRTQERQNLQDRAAQVGSVVVFAASAAGPGPVVRPGNVLDPQVAATVSDEAFLQLLANRLGRADVLIRIGLTTTDAEGSVSVVPASNGTYGATLTASPEPGQARERLSASAPRLRDRDAHPDRSRGRSRVR